MALQTARVRRRNGRGGYALTSSQAFLSCRGGGAVAGWMPSMAQKVVISLGQKTERVGESGQGRNRRRPGSQTDACPCGRLTQWRRRLVGVDIRARSMDPSAASTCPTRRLPSLLAPICLPEHGPWVGGEQYQSTASFQVVLGQTRGGQGRGRAGTGRRRLTHRPGRRSRRALSPI